MEENNNERKARCFEYIIDLLQEWYEEKTGKKDAIQNHFTKLSLLKMVFLIASIKNEDGEDLLDIFDDFVALPYGPVEKDLYKIMQDDKLSKYKITDRSITLK